MIGPHSIVIVKYSTSTQMRREPRRSKGHDTDNNRNAQAAALTATGLSTRHSVQATARRPQNRPQQSPQRGTRKFVLFTQTLTNTYAIMRSCFTCLYTYSYMQYNVHVCTVLVHIEIIGLQIGC